MIDWINITTSTTELRIINSIAKRYWKKQTHLDFTSLQMDIELAHNHHEILLEDLLKANEGDFLHDISGIQHHINRETGKLENCFSPRYSA